MKIWVDSSGYFTCVKTPNCKLYVKEESISDSIIEKQSNTLLFINAGGTIVSTSSSALTGVVPTQNLIKEVPLILDFYNYHPGIKKLSEDFTYLDYLKIKKIIVNSKSKKIFVTHGTDYISSFGVWIDLIAKKYDKKILIAISQRSLDKPTEDLTSLILKSKEIFNKMKRKGCLIFTKAEVNYILHSPYQIKKYDTFKKNCFYSEEKVQFEEKVPKLKNIFNLNYILKEDNELDYLLDHPLVKVQIESFFTSALYYNSIKVGSGIGNLRGLKRSKYNTYSKCLSGPTNYNIYQKNIKTLEPKITSWESAEALVNFSKRC